MVRQSDITHTVLRETVPRRTANCSVKLYKPNTELRVEPTGALLVVEQIMSDVHVIQQLTMLCLNDKAC